MKILLCHNYYKTRAGEGLVFEHEKNLLIKNGNDVQIYTRDNNEINSFSAIKRFGSFLSGFSNKKTQNDIDRIIAESRPDIAHIHNVFPLISPAIYEALKRHQVPIVQTFHNFRFICPNGLLFIDKKECPYFLKKSIHCVKNKCYRQSYIYSAWYSAILAYHAKKNTFIDKIDKYIALNSFTKNIFVKAGFDSKKIIVKPNSASANTSSFNENPDNYIIFAGRLSQEKGVLTLLKAAAKVPSLPLKILGDGPLENKIKQFISENNLTHVELLGYQPQIEFEKYISNALVTILPSECFENCPLTVINSLYLGTPVIASRTGGIPDFVPEEKAGWLFTPGNSEELTQRLKWIENNKNKIIEMRSRVREWGVKQFSPENNYKKLMKIYNEIKN